MIEEHVNKIAKLQEANDNAIIKMTKATAGIDARIADAKHVLGVLKEHRTGVAAPYVIEIMDNIRQTDEIQTQIIDEWTGEEKTMVFDAGTLKFRTTRSLIIKDETWLLHDILDRMSIEEMFVAEIEYKTTVKLEQKSD